MNINVIWGPGAANNAAPAGFYTAVNYVVNLFDHLFTNNVTININVGYGSIVDPATGTAYAVDPTALGESWGANWTTQSYGQVVAALQAQNAPGSASLPSTSPEPSGYTLMMDNAEAKALGLAGPSSALDGSIGIATDASAGGWDYSATTPPTSTQTDIIGTIEHEFSEVMGRYSFPFYDPYSNTGQSQYTVLDLYRYGSIQG